MRMDLAALLLRLSHVSIIANESLGIQYCITNGRLFDGVEVLMIIPSHLLYTEHYHQLFIQNCKLAFFVVVVLALLYIAAHFRRFRPMRLLR